MIIPAIIIALSIIAAASIIHSGLYKIALALIPKGEKRDLTTEMRQYHRERTNHK